MRIIKYILLFLIVFTIVLYSIICLFLYTFQEKLLFFPSGPYLPHYEKISKDLTLKNLKITTHDQEIIDGWMQVDSEKPYMVLYFGGNGDETSYFVEKYRYKKANIASFNYRGYAYSTGKPSERSLFADAIEQYDYLTNDLRIPPEKIIVMGRSLGTGVATYLASQRKVNSVILISPYDSVESVAKEGYFFVPVSLLLKNKFPSEKYAKIQKNPLLCIYGGRDTTIPNLHTERLLSHWNGEVKKVFIADATHDNIYSFVQVEESINGFIPVN